MESPTIIDLKTATGDQLEHLREQIKAATAVAVYQIKARLTHPKYVPYQDTEMNEIADRITSDFQKVGDDLIRAIEVLEGWVVDPDPEARVDPETGANGAATGRWRPKVATST